ncbi:MULTISPECIES: DUF262 domain-containing protein [unclassified Microbulbifer]|uniref:DUF262 domain-containing protein n=1 Tax=unclassified Microbulbifer TaxID=2619833 RepID=UPI0027E4F3EB|nr:MULTISPECIES: DUF262 domain-containing protein [unclassified Microbulbifer]
MKKRDPKPQISRLEELVIQVRSGDIKLPKFQRQFVWRESDILKLFDSIYKGYPIGSLLLWHSSQKLTSEREILGVSLNTNEAILFPTNYLLDGQQRLTSLCGALYWDGKDEGSKWNIGFNLETETFHHMKSAPDGNYFPLNKLMRTSEFLSQCTQYSNNKNYSSFVASAENLLRAIKDYKLAVVIIGDMTVEEVAPIFERINSTGRKLTIVDLMMAATWRSDFDLNAEILKIQENCENLGYPGIPSKIILRSIATAADLGINKDDIQKLRKLDSTKLKEISNKTRVSTEKSVEFFINQIEAYDYSYIPYALQFNYVVEFFNTNTNPRKEDIEELKSWIWFTSATRHFGTSNSGQNKEDLDNIRKYGLGISNSLFTRGTIDISRLLFDKFNLRNATSTSIALILGTAQPKTSADGRNIDESYKYIKNSKFYASLIPKDIHYSKLNISQAIHTFPQRAIENFNLTDLSHLFIDNSARNLLLNEKFEEFIAKRSEHIAHFIREMTDCDPIFSLPTLPDLDPVGDPEKLLDEENFDLQDEDD